MNRLNSHQEFSQLSSRQNIKPDSFHPRLFFMQKNESAFHISVTNGSFRGGSFHYLYLAGQLLLPFESCRTPENKCSLFPSPKRLVHCTNMIICVFESLPKSAQTQFITVVVFVNFYSASTDKTTDLCLLAVVGGVCQRKLPGTWSSSSLVCRGRGEILEKSQVKQ